MIINKKTLLLSASVLTLSSVSFIGLSHAQSCSGGQQRTYVCEDPDGNVVADSLCGSIPLPSDNLAVVACNITNCGPINGQNNGSGENNMGFDTDEDGIADSTTCSGGCGCCGVAVAEDMAPIGSVTGWGASVGAGESKVLCGHYFAQGILSAHLYQGDLAYAQNVRENTKRGYWFWAVPLTNYLNNNPGGLIEKFVRPFVIGWATEMAYRTGYSDTGHWFGKTLITIAEPAVNFLGKFVGDTNPHKLKSEKKIKQMKTLSLVSIA